MDEFFIRRCTFLFQFRSPLPNYLFKVIDKILVTYLMIGLATDVNEIAGAGAGQADIRFLGLTVH